MDKKDAILRAVGLAHFLPKTREIVLLIAQGLNTAIFISSSSIWQRFRE